MKIYDHKNFHTHVANQRIHFITSAIFLLCPFFCLLSLQAAVYTALLSFFVRQYGHVKFEPIEVSNIGFNDTDKQNLIIGYIMSSLLGFCIQVDAHKCIILHTCEQIYNHVVRMKDGHLWIIKILTDPLTDIYFYYDSFVEKKDKHK